MSSPRDDALWQRIADHHIGPPDASLTFAARLARENRWSPDHAERVIGEYKRFCYLAVTAGHPVTPSDAVDQAWHLHLTYSRDYWERFCPDILRADLHHGPTAGGPVERERYYRQYADTLAAYEAAFGAVPPADIWPNAHRRFAVDPGGVRVNFFGGIMLPRRVALALAIAVFMAGWLAGRIM
ncbi:hypothetical protein [Porphyrobacter sp. YT40]|uniref:glycine-rich domain-containing protein n=1 Tax=Porphyrobacter sp. YT40 TaxID=2547601 RepID=UPI001141C2D5|nr:hypothetical protein [Porphyrobacter sp. YT40]QDH34647.1 hypothetical protein E2E27_10125 [Porphyrobacter sp. YT40]